MQHTYNTNRNNNSGARRTLAVAATFVAGALVVGSLQAGHVAQAAGGQGSFQPYKDARLGFALSKPDGWKVQTSEQSILVASPDKSELMLTEMFHAAQGDTAAQWLDKLSYKYSGLFPQAGLESQNQQHVKGDEVVAALHYQGPNGAAKLHVLCSIVNGKGIVYAFAAPADRFAAEGPKLIHIAKSLVFTVPKSSGGNGAGGGSAAAPNLHWANWKEPRQGAFTVSVPQGWQTIGGVAGGGTDEHLVVGSASPDKNISIVLGDPRLGTFTGPNQFTQRQEGRNGVLHYMRASEFNAFYLHEFVSQGIDDIQIGSAQDLDDLSRQATELENQQHGGGVGNRDFGVSVGITTFTGTDKQSHKPIQGGIFSVTRRGTMHMNGMESTTWTANPEIITCVAGGESNRWATALAVTHHMEQTFREEPDWLKRRQGEIQKGTEIALAATAARSKEIARKSAAAEDAIMGRYESRRQAQGGSAASDDQQRGFINYIGDRTDVSDGNGHTANVGSGMSHYYRNDRTGTIMGTDSAYSPGVDFTPMTEY